MRILAFTLLCAQTFLNPPPDPGRGAPSIPPAEAILRAIPAPMPPAEDPAAAVLFAAPGHRIVAEIADAFIDAKTAKAVQGILLTESLADVSTWPDEIRSRPEGKGKEPLHYINVPRTATKVDMRRDGADKKNVVDAIAHYRAILADDTRPRTERRDALAFVVHFVGDIHQPLHVSYADDRGGNDTVAHYFGQYRKLHQIWDGAIIERRLGGAPYQALVVDLLAAADDERVSALRRAVDPVDWANESLALTRSEVYAMPDAKVLDDGYDRRSQKIIEDRLLAAGVRLGALLDAVFAGKGADAAAVPDEREALRRRARAGRRTLSPGAVAIALACRIDGDKKSVLSALIDPPIAVADDLRAISPVPFVRPAARIDLRAYTAADIPTSQTIGDRPFGAIAGAGLLSDRYLLGRSPSGEMLVQPRRSFQGDVARAILFAALADDIALSQERIETCLRWSEEDPPDDAERAREERVKKVVRGENPFIADPSAAVRIFRAVK